MRATKSGLVIVLAWLAAAAPLQGQQGTLVGTVTDLETGASVAAGEVPPALRDPFGPYPPMFERMFANAGVDLTFETVRVFDGEALPDTATLDAALFTGSAAGVYDDYPWLEPLRHFIRRAYAMRTPMLGICFGHQVMADALGGDVRRSEKGWGLGRHVYAVTGKHPVLLDGGLAEVAVACSHQDQVIAPPPEAEVFLSSEFTPNAGLIYRNRAAVSLQPHPEFTDDYALALAELRRGRAPDAVVDTAIASISRPSDSGKVAGFLGAFLREH